MEELNETPNPFDPSILQIRNPEPNPRKQEPETRPERDWRRESGWEQKHRALLDAKSRMRFAWGSNDCMTFAGDAVVEQGFPDPMVDWRGKYSTARAAMEIVNSKPGGLLEWALEIFKDFPQIRSRSAKRGDVVYIEAEREIAFGAHTSRREMMGVCDGAFAVVLTPNGTATIDMKYARKAWAIGHK